ncbi:heterogeneous nuclear ribonucleoprotein A3-like [Oopsacas minuta]|uniref:Heterogeneous nuclear ribonucleoprotein A3-like n=1 Tax=Oopsacas minuta TaxID=111878 RepID=A0AAV7KAB3_9METZ|nr:heterogeneous nuclear ribonucleoprotein A3-like [Oopsacas minuta]
MSSATRDSTSQLCKVFVGGIAITTDDETFRNYFSEFGNVVDSVIIRDQLSNRSKGFGFITFDKPERVDELLEKRPFSIDGKEVEVKRAIPREEISPIAHTKTKKIFVGGLSKEVTSDEVRDHFEEKFGGVDEVQFIYDKDTQEFRGFCFVTMNNEDVVDKIVIDQSHSFRNKPCTVKKAEPKGTKSSAALPHNNRISNYASLGAYYYSEPSPLDLYYMGYGYGATGYDRFNPLGQVSHTRGATSSSLYSATRGRYRPY